MKFQVITLFPEMIEAFSSEGVIGQARKKSLLEISTIQPRDFTEDVHKTVDDRPFGGGDGMIMLAEPVEKALLKARSRAVDEKPWVIYLSPQGQTLTQAKVEELTKHQNLILLCGRYGGIDQRVLNEYVDEEISIGDYIISGGELAAGVLMDAVSRQIPGVLGHENSAQMDSFSSGTEGLLEAPHYTRPREFRGQTVPQILLSGNHKLIEQWRRSLSLLQTLQKRPDLLMDQEISPQEMKNLKKFWQELSSEDQKVLGVSALSEADFAILEKHV